MGLDDVQRAIRETVSTRRQTPQSAASPATFLFNDTFTNFYNPDIGMAGGRVLHRIGCRPAARTQRLLRPSADLAGAARRGAGTCRTQRRRAVSARRTRRIAFSFSSRAACRRSARTRRRCCAARSNGEAQRRRRRVRAVRGLRRERAGRRRARSKPGRPRSCCTATVTRRRWGCCRRRARCFRASRRNRRRPQRRLLRHGRIVRLRPQITTTSREPSASDAAAGCAKPDGRVGARRERRLVPPSSRRLHRRAGASSRRAHSLAHGP